MPVTQSVRNPITLSELLGGDETRVLRVLRAFRNAANNDLLQLDAAVREGNAELARQTAYGLAMACHLIGEGFAGSQLDALARAEHQAAIDPVMTQLIAHARTALIDSIARVSLRIEAADED
ncbi:MAG TPA: hypothetical protein VGE88_17590 [Lysobacter sp.]